MLSINEYENLIKIISTLNTFSENKIVEKEYPKINKEIVPLFSAFSLQMEDKIREEYSYDSKNSNEDVFMTVMQFEIKNFLATHYVQEKIEQKLEALSTLSMSTRHIRDDSHAIRNFSTAFGLAKNALTKTYNGYFNQLKDSLTSQRILALMIYRLFSVSRDHITNNINENTFIWHYTQRKNKHGTIMGPSLTNLARQFKTFYDETCQAIKNKNLAQDISSTLLADITLTMEIFSLTCKNLMDAQPKNKSNLNLRVMNEILNLDFQQKVILAVAHIPYVNTFSLSPYDEQSLTTSLNNHTDVMEISAPATSKKRKPDQVPETNTSVQNEKHEFDNIDDDLAVDNYKKRKFDDNIINKEPEIQPVGHITIEEESEIKSDEMVDHKNDTLVTTPKKENTKLLKRQITSTEVTPQKKNILISYDDGSNEKHPILNSSALVLKESNNNNASNDNLSYQPDLQIGKGAPPPPPPPPRADYLIFRGTDLSYKSPIANVHVFADTETNRKQVALLSMTAAIIYVKQNSFSFLTFSTTGNREEDITDKLTETEKESIHNLTNATINANHVDLITKIKNIHCDIVKAQGKAAKEQLNDEAETATIEKPDPLKNMAAMAAERSQNVDTEKSKKLEEARQAKIAAEKLAEKPVINFAANLKKASTVNNNAQASIKDKQAEENQKSNFGFNLKKAETNVNNVVKQENTEKSSVNFRTLLKNKSNPAEDKQTEEKPTQNIGSALKRTVSNLNQTVKPTASVNSTFVMPVLRSVNDPKSDESKQKAPTDNSLFNQKKSVERTNNNNNVAHNNTRDNTLN